MIGYNIVTANKTKKEMDHAGKTKGLGHLLVAL